MKSFDLKSGQKIPALGFGTWQLQGEKCLKAVGKALEVGYRHFDTADAYDNHAEVAQAIGSSGIKREDLFITTKVWRSDLYKTDILNSGKRFLSELKVDYLDLLLLHWPNSGAPIQESLEGLASLKSQGFVKSIGVSNFTVRHLEEALKTGISFDNNQVEIHPSFPQPELVKFCQKNGIVVTAYSPIAQGEDLKLPIIQELAQKLQKSESQVILNWVIQKGLVAIPRSSDPAHIEDNFKTLDWELSAEDVALIDTIGGKNRRNRPGFNEFGEG